MSHVKGLEIIFLYMNSQLIFNKLFLIEYILIGCDINMCNSCKRTKYYVNPTSKNISKMFCGCNKNSDNVKLMNNKLYDSYSQKIRRMKQQDKYFYGVKKEGKKL